jgi:hypothetical protein
MHCPHLFLCHCCCSCCCNCWCSPYLLMLCVVVAWSLPCWSLQGFQGSLLRYHVKTQRWCVTDAGSWLSDVFHWWNCSRLTQWGLKGPDEPRCHGHPMCLWYSLHDVHKDACMLRRWMDGWIDSK